MAGMRETLATSVLTGFLGSGKTTLLRRALSSPALADTAVIINELGEIGIDHHLVDVVDGNILELPGGCLCCAMREDLARTLRHLLDRRAAGEVRTFRRIVIETTGLADPAPILYTLGADPMLDAELRLARVVTLVDAVTGAGDARPLRRGRPAGRGRRRARHQQDRPGAVRPRPRRPARRAQPRRRARRRRRRSRPRRRAVRAGAAHPPPQPSPACGGGRRDPPPQAGEGWGGGCRRTPPTATASTPSRSPSTAAVTRLDFARALGGLARARGNDLLRVKGIVLLLRPTRAAGRRARRAARDLRAGMARRVARRRPPQPPRLHRPRDPARGDPRAFRLCHAARCWAAPWQPASP